MASFQRRSADEWGSLVREHEVSGLSAKAFCKERGIGEASFYKWHQRFAAEKSLPVSPALSFMDVSALAMAPGRERGRQQWEIELELGEGLVLRLNRG